MVEYGAELDITVTEQLAKQLGGRARDVGSWRDRHGRRDQSSALVVLEDLDACDAEHGLGLEERLGDEEPVFFRRMRKEGLQVRNFETTRVAGAGVSLRQPHRLVHPRK